MEKLIKQVKRPRTALKVLSINPNVSIFRITTFGSTNARPIATNVIRYRIYEVWKGVRTNEYPGKLNQNQRAEKYPLSTN